ncbi:acyl-CoA synthetase [Sphingomonas colocasiae]|uniref:Acyl-CoA synthetase n=1 Tax=Sphingomonas colocasiae TaxID=1848973 RepID=A0ABS7PVE1_9SPHN|nr:acyl-CoA synthetase [Sphingomonas colocasiae]MBY8824342.1 acyl-CoA synthetase [Sphingomonas colocasiae]
MQLHPSCHAASSPDKTATIMASTGETVTFAQLDARSNQAAQLFRARGIGDGACIGLLMENSAAYFDIAWAAQRAGLYYVCISTKLSAGEADYILEDSGTRLLVVSAGLAPLARAIRDLRPELPMLLIGGIAEDFDSFEAAVADMPATPIPDEANGAEMLYSSGTTGRPKGVKPNRTPGPLNQGTGLTDLGQRLYGMDGDTIYLSPAPLYHAAPLRWSMTVHRFGGTVVVMDKYDPERALQLIEQHRVTHAQWVPTHFVRMLKLPEEVRTRYDLSSLKTVFHAAAPCPVPIKQAMLDWWGPIIHEYYAGTEANGFTAIGPQEWLDRPGSVGRSMWGEVKIVDDDDNVLPARKEGAIFFADGPKFSYHNDPEKTEQATNRHGWTTIGDVGWLDEDGYLYLTDRKSYMIISGGVNIYPQEIEDLLIAHPKVADAAVVSAPCEDFGEKVAAAIIPAEGIEPSEALAAELREYARENLSHVKTPKILDFVTELPRLPTGKLQKRLLRDKYWQKDAAAS